jgi:hypothetical protein
MRRWLRRIRGAIGMGLTWAAGWAPIGVLTGVLVNVVFPGFPPLGLGTVVAVNATTFAVLGFVGGTIFATVLRLTEGHRRFDELSLWRFTGWGAVGGLLLGGVAVTVGLWGSGFGQIGAAMIGAATLLGAGSASSSLALARRADDRALPKARADVADAGSKQTERHRQPGRHS